MAFTKNDLSVDICIHVPMRATLTQVHVYNDKLSVQKTTNLTNRTGSSMKLVRLKPQGPK